MQPDQSILLHILNINLIYNLTSNKATNNICRIATQPLNNDCYCVYDYETCFPLTGPWRAASRPVEVGPESPDKIAASFYFFQPGHFRNEDGFALDPTDYRQLISLPFEAKRSFKILIHGYLSHSDTIWHSLLRQKLASTNDYNIIVVDWNAGAVPPYSQSAANTRLVAFQLSYLIYKLHETRGIPISEFHLIGHSLGAHLAGYVGNYLKADYGAELSRITGLDPAEPYFRNTDRMVHLDTTDAQFVDVIHTDNTPLLGFQISFGMESPIGHLDFYPNWEDLQPGCEGSVSCAHVRVLSYFAESVKTKCKFWAVACPSYEEFLNGLCWGCTDQHPCSIMGNEAILPHSSVPPSTKFFLLTNDRSPFCGYHYRISVTMRNSTSLPNFSGEAGIVLVKLIAGDHSSQFLPLSTSSDTDSPFSVSRAQKSAETEFANIYSDSPARFCFCSQPTMGVILREGLSQGSMDNFFYATNGSYFSDFRRSQFYDTGSTHHRVVLAPGLPKVDSVIVKVEQETNLFSFLSFLRIKSPVYHFYNISVESLPPGIRKTFCFQSPVNLNTEYLLETKLKC